MVGNDERKDANPPAIELRGISKRFGNRTVLDEINLSIARGEIFALLGASGSGKSTILKIVAGIEQPDRGQIWLSGTDVTATPSHRREVHTVFQNYALFPHLNVAGNVSFPLAVAGVPKLERKRRVAEALSWVRMDEMIDRRVESLSGGERQRVALARALVDGIECVLLDEPLSALDPHLRAQTLEFLQEIQTRLRVTYLYVTHDRAEALRAAHRIGVLRLGSLEQVGTPEQIYQRPATAFVASFIGPINWMTGKVNSRSRAPQVELDCGTPIPLDGQSLPESTRVRVGLRPEHVQLGQPALLQARVVQRQFSGPVVSIRLQVDGGSPLTAELSSTNSLPEIGQSVSVRWVPSVAHVFPEEP